MLALVERAILFYRDEGITGERFADTIARLGFDYVEDKLLNGSIDKDSILKMCIRDRMKDWLLKKLIETTDNVPMKTMLPGRTYGEE